MEVKWGPQPPSHKGRLPALSRWGPEVGPWRALPNLSCTELRKSGPRQVRTLVRGFAADEW